MGADWSEKTAERIIQERKGRFEEATAQRVRDKLRQEQGPGLWDQVKDYVRSKCMGLNLKLGEDVVTSPLVRDSQLDVTYKAPNGYIHRLQASFDVTSADNALRWKVTGNQIGDPREGKCQLSVSNDVVGFLTGAHPYTPESLAEKMLDDLLVGPR